MKAFSLLAFLLMTAIPLTVAYPISAQLIESPISKSVQTAEYFDKRGVDKAVKGDLQGARVPESALR